MADAASSRFTTKKYQWIGRALGLHHSPTHLHLHVNLDDATSANNDCQSVHATIAADKERYIYTYAHIYLEACIITKLSETYIGVKRLIGYSE